MLGRYPRSYFEPPPRNELSMSPSPSEVPTTDYPAHPRHHLGDVHIDLSRRGLVRPNDCGVMSFIIVFCRPSRPFLSLRRRMCVSYIWSSSSLDVHSGSLTTTRLLGTSSHAVACPCAGWLQRTLRNRAGDQGSSPSCSILSRVLQPLPSNFPHLIHTSYYHPCSRSRFQLSSPPFSLYYTSMSRLRYSVFCILAS